MGLFSCFSIHSYLIAADKPGARFLSLPPGARELALGSASSAVADDVNALYWNPAGLSRIPSFQWGFTHARLSAGSQYNFVAGARPFGKGTIGMGGMYFDHGSQDGRSASGEPTGAFSSSDRAFSLAYSIRSKASFQWGVALKGVESRIGQDRAQTYAFDSGVQWKPLSSDSTRVGLAVRNAGPSMRFIDQKDSLPLLVAVGFQRKIHDSIQVAAEWQQERSGRNSNLVFGTEMALSPSVFVRGGYSSLGKPPDPGSALSGLVGGIGLHILNHRLDYAFVPGTPAEESHRLSFLMTFGAPTASPESAPLPKLIELLSVQERQIIEVRPSDSALITSGEFFQEISFAGDTRQEGHQNE